MWEKSKGRRLVVRDSILNSEAGVPVDGRAGEGLWFVGGGGALGANDDSRLRRLQVAQSASAGDREEVSASRRRQIIHPRGRGCHIASDERRDRRGS